MKYNKFPNENINKTHTLIIISILVLLFNSCNSKNKLRQELNNLKSNYITIPKFQTIVNGKDTLISDHFISDYKMVIYADSTECTTCKISELRIWKSYIKYSVALNGKLKFYFLFSPNNKTNLYSLLATNTFDYPVCIDINGDFEKLNPHLPKNKAMHTFLLDENNNVILVGNPLYNKEIEKLFYKMTQEKLSK